MVLQIFLLHIKQEKTLHKFHRQHLFLFILSSFISRTFGDILDNLEGLNLLKQVCLPNAFWASRTRWSFFYWPKAVCWEFLLAWDQRFTVSVEPCTKNFKVHPCFFNPGRRYILVMGLHQKREPEPSRAALFTSALNWLHGPPR